MEGNLYDSMESADWQGPGVNYDAGDTRHEY